MPSYKVTDPTTGRSMKVTGDSPPTEQELEGIFAQFKDAHAPSSDGTGRLGQIAMGAAKFTNPFLSMTPERLKADALSAERALLTNEPTQGMAEGVLRGAPAAVGGAIGGTAGLVAGAPLTAAALGTSLGGAALGGSAGESVRQAAAQAYTGLTGRGSVQRPGAVVRDVAIQGATQVPGQAMNLGTALIAKYGAKQLPAMLKNFFGISEPITEYVQGRGAGNVFTEQNLNKGAPMDNIGAATADLEASRAATGSKIAPAENSVIDKVGNRTPPIRHIREGLEDALVRRGITDPKTAGLARNRESGILKKLVDVLTPSGIQVPEPGGLGITNKTVSEKLTLRQAVNAKRLIDDNLDFADKDLSTSTEQLLKKVNGQIRAAVREDLGPDVAKLWDDYSTIRDAQDKLSEFTGTQARSSVQQRAVQSLRGIMVKNPKEVGNIVRILGDGLPGGEAQARQIFDSIAAEMFTKGGIGAPSSTLLKTATAGGLLSGPVARGMVSGSEALNNFAASPATYSRSVSPAIDALRSMRNKK